MGKARKFSRLSALDSRKNYCMDKLSLKFYPYGSEKAHVVALELAKFYYDKVVLHDIKKGFITPAHIEAWKYNRNVVHLKCYPTDRFGGKAIKKEGLWQSSQENRI